MLNAFEYRDFRLIWISSMAASFGMQMQIVARGWLTYDITGSALALSGVMIAFMAPSMVISPIGGVIADRFDKKPVMIASQTLNAIATGIFACIIFFGWVNYWHFIYFGLINGTVLALSMPARSTIVPEIVGPKNLTNAMMLTSSTYNAARILGPTIAGLLIGWFAAGDTTSTTGVGLVFFCITGLYLGSVVWTILLDFRGEPQRQHNPPVWDDIVEAIQFTWHDKVVKGLIWIGLVPMSFGFAPTFLMPVYNAELLSNRPEDYGFLLTGMGVGALSGSLIFAQAGDLRRKGRTLFISSYFWCAALVGFSLCTTMFSAVIALFFVGLAYSAMGSLNMSMLQLAVPAEMRGRVMSIWWTVHGLMPLGIIPIAWIAEAFSIRTAMLVSALLVGGTSLLFRFMYPEVAKVRSGHTDHPIPPAETTVTTAAPPSSGTSPAPEFTNGSDNTASVQASRNSS
ncbi:MAG: MFS transporter [Gammaproteobacteria bacterium]|nr:MFS transporter [Gammaproteobacteria bacterium]